MLRGDVIGDSLFYTGFYEYSTTKALLEIGRNEGGLFFDVGANIGYYSILWAKAKAGNRSVSIEAAPRNIELLEANIKKNHVEGSCQLMPFAASNTNGTHSFDLGPESQTGWGGISLGKVSGNGLISVSCKPLDEMVSEGQSIRLLKIDVEGAEALVFEGMEKILRAKQVREIWFEDNVERRQKLDIPQERLMSILAKYGYQVLQSSRNKSLPMDYVAIARS